MFWLIFAIALWGIVHSFLASLAAKDFAESVLGRSISRFYRLAYNAFAVISFAPIPYLVASLPDRSLYVIPAPWSFLPMAGQALAAVALMVTAMQTGVLSFMGLSQIAAEESPARLVTTGLYRWVRHPLYLLGLLILWLTPVMTANLLVTYLALTAYLFVGAYFEERKLLREFGKEYAEYRSQTPMIIPFTRLRRVRQASR